MKKWFKEDFEWEIAVTGFLRGSETEGYCRERAEKAFGFLVTAFKYGAPPHGGIAPGLDRLVMLMRHEESIYEVIAFPKNNLAASPMDECPAPVDEAQLRELRIRVGGVGMHAARDAP